MYGPQIERLKRDSKKLEISIRRLELNSPSSNRIKRIKTKKIYLDEAIQSIVTEVRH